MTVNVETLEAFEQEAVRAIRALSQSESATLVTLSGELGAGKTAFTKAVAKHFGITDLVTSPTFILEKIYQLPQGQPFRRLVHIDAYRLESGTELAPLGFDELMKNPDTIVFLEWPEKVAHALPPPTLAITISVNTDNSRTIFYGKN